MIGFCGIMATVFTIVTAALMAGAVASIGEWPDAVHGIILLIGVGVHMALWYGVFALLCKITHAR